MLDDPIALRSRVHPPCLPTGRGGFAFNLSGARQAISGLDRHRQPEVPPHRTRRYHLVNTPEPLRTHGANVLDDPAGAVKTRTSRGAARETAISGRVEALWRIGLRGGHAADRVYPACARAARQGQRRGPPALHRPGLRRHTTSTATSPKRNPEPHPADRRARPPRAPCPVFLIFFFYSRRNV